VSKPDTPQRILLCVFRTDFARLNARIPWAAEVSVVLAILGGVNTVLFALYGHDVVWAPIVLLGLCAFFSYTAVGLIRDRHRRLESASAV